MNVPWSTLRTNPRDQRERAAAGSGERVEHSRLKEAEREIAWDVTEFGRRMAFGGIVSSDQGAVVAKNPSSFV